VTGQRPKAIPVVQQLAPRQRDKFVPLPLPAEAGGASSDEGAPEEPDAQEPLLEPARIRIHSVAEGLRRKELEALLRKLYDSSQIHCYEDVIHLAVLRRPHRGYSGKPKALAGTSAANQPVPVGASNPTHLSDSAAMQPGLVPYTGESGLQQAFLPTTAMYVSVASGPSQNDLSARTPTEDVSLVSERIPLPSLEEQVDTSSAQPSSFTDEVHTLGTSYQNHSSIHTSLDGRPLSPEPFVLEHQQPESLLIDAVDVMPEIVDVMPAIDFMQGGVQAPGYAPPSPTLARWPPSGQPAPMSSLVKDCFFFDYGVVAMFGLTDIEEQHILEEVVALVENKPYSAEEVEVDSFQFVYSTTKLPHIKDDVFTINRRQARNHTVRMALAHALAQSSKLRLYEERVETLVLASKHLPEQLAENGEVRTTIKNVAQLIGQLFLQSANVNLLSNVLDMPSFGSADHLQALYERAHEYLELDQRVKVLNARFDVLQEMFDVLRDHLNTSHANLMEWMIIWLLAAGSILMVVQVLSIFAIVGS